MQEGCTRKKKARRSSGVLLFISTRAEILPRKNKVWLLLGNRLYPMLENSPFTSTSYLGSHPQPPAQWSLNPGHSVYAWALCLMGLSSCTQSCVPAHSCTSITQQSPPPPFCWITGQLPLPGGWNTKEEAMPSICHLSLKASMNKMLGQ